MYVVVLFRVPRRGEDEKPKIWKVSKPVYRQETATTWVEQWIARHPNQPAPEVWPQTDLEDLNDLTDDL